MKASYKYFAFISYSRKNSRAAAFVQRRLEHFRIPLKHVAVENRPAKGRFMRPVFRDKRDLDVSEGSFTGDIRRALEESRYLLVICSRESAASKWVNEEIKYFLACHANDLASIVPIVLDGDPGCGTERECLPESLRDVGLVTLGIDGRMTERNLPTMIPDEGAKEIDGWENGVIQTLSYLLKVNRESVKASIDAERVRQMKIYAIIAAVCTCIFAGLAFWAVKAERRADANRKIAEANEVRAVAGEKEAIKQRTKAEDNEKRALIAEKEACVREKEALQRKDQVERLQTMQNAFLVSWGKMNSIDTITDILNDRIKASTNELDILSREISLIAGHTVVELMLAAMEHDLECKLPEDVRCRVRAEKNGKKIVSDAKMRLDKYEPILYKLDQKVSYYRSIGMTNKNDKIDGVSLEIVVKLQARIRKIVQENKNAIAFVNRTLNDSEVILFQDHDRLFCSNKISKIVGMMNDSCQNEVFDAVEHIPDSCFKSEVLWLLITKMDGIDYQMKRFYAELAISGIRRRTSNAYGLAVWYLRLCRIAMIEDRRSDAQKFLNHAIDILCDNLKLGLDSYNDVYQGVDMEIVREFFLAKKKEYASCKGSYRSVSWDMRCFLRAYRGLSVLPKVEWLYMECKHPRFKGWELDWDYAVNAHCATKTKKVLVPMYMELNAEEINRSLALHRQLAEKIKESGNIQGAAELEIKINAITDALKIR